MEPLNYSDYDKILDDNYKLREELGRLQKKYNKLIKKNKHRKRVMTSQAQKIRQYQEKDDRQYYINVNKGVRKK
jgi:hypothetical protein